MVVRPFLMDLLTLNLLTRRGRPQKIHALLIGCYKNGSAKGSDTPARSNQATGCQSSARALQAQMKPFRRFLYLPVRLFYRWIYAPIADAIERYKHRHNPPV